MFDGTNPGLQFEKIPDKISYFESSFKYWQWLSNNRPEWLRSTVKYTANCSTSKNIERMQRLVSSAYPTSDALSMQFKLDQPLAIGLGIDSPLEIGCLFHHTIGLPYIPGSAIKGCTRACAEHWLGVDKDIVERLFGTEHAEDAAEEDLNAGSLIFFDALPVQAALTLDVMTPHHNAYHADTNGNSGTIVWPDDSTAPNIHTFLVVPAGTEFQFALAINRARKNHQDGDLKIGSDLLFGALEYLGLGSKTSRGYGRFQVPQD